MYWNQIVCIFFWPKETSIFPLERDFQCILLQCRTNFGTIWNFIGTYVWTLLNELCSLPSGFYESCTHSHTYTRKHKRTHTLYTSLPYVRIQATSFTQRALEHRIWNAHKCVSFTVNCSLHSFGSFCFVRYWRHLLWTEK